MISRLGKQITVREFDYHWVLHKSALVSNKANMNGRISSSFFSLISFFSILVFLFLFRFFYFFFLGFYFFIFYIFAWVESFVIM